MGTVVQLDVTARTYKCASCGCDDFNLIAVASDIRVICGNPKCLIWCGELTNYEREG